MAGLRVVATAGHVDHGKSTIVKALTGTDPDRFAEEQARGLTIDLGFAWLTLPSGRELAFVDVPGHVRFVKNMLAGVGAVEACLFVVAADDGWMPQSEEHLRILELLGIGRGVVALTKVGIVDPERRRAARAEVEAHVAGSFLAAAPIVEVDVPAGCGVEALVAALDELVAEVPARRDEGRPRLWIDRVFAARGAGTVVTGTLTGGALGEDDELVVVPGPGVGHRPLRVRVRGLQAHGRALSVAEAGGRVALNLVGAERRQLVRGQALVRAGQWEPATSFDVTVSVLPGLGHEVGRRGAYQLHVGAAQQPVRLRLLGAELLAPGDVGCARLHTPAPLALLPGDRYVLRESGRAETVGGGEILEVAPVLLASRAAPDRSIERIVRERVWVRADLLERLTGVARPPDVGPWVVDPAARQAAEEELRARLAAAGARGVELATLDERERALLSALADVTISGGRALAAGAAAAGAAGLDVEEYLAALARAPFSPPLPSEHGVDAATLRELVRRGVVVGVQGCWFSAEAIATAAATVAALLRAHPEGFSVSELRAALGTSRKYALPLLAHLDATGVTRRHGDRRDGGPALGAGTMGTATAADSSP